MGYGSEKFVTCEEWCYYRENPDLLAREELQACTGACGVIKATSSI